MATKLMIQNLPCDVTEDALEEVFSQIGEVESVKIESELFTRKSKCVGFIEMALDVDAYRAVHCFNGATFKDRRILLKESKPLYERAKDALAHQVSELTRHAE
jgi:RNA recognition motif-containing protein